MVWWLRERLNTRPLSAAVRWELRAVCERAAPDPGHWSSRGHWDIFMGRQGHHGIMIQTITHSLRCCNAFYDLQMLQHRSTKINHDILQGTSNIFTWLKYFQKQNLKLFRLKLNICKTCNVPCCQCCRWLSEARSRSDTDHERSYDSGHWPLVVTWVSGQLSSVVTI